jgi:CheY-like chemotaxis protein
MLDDLNAVEILLVEDNPHDAELTMMALNDALLANRLVWVEDGEQALDFLLAREKFSHRKIENKPKLILLDLKMPKVDGMEVLREIRADERIKHIPIVVLTSSSEEQDILNTYNLGVNSYIVKPVEFEKFLAAVKQIGLYWLLMNKLP